MRRGTGGGAAPAPPGYLPSKDGGTEGGPAGRGHARFDWPALMRAGMTGLGLRPAEFWALTPAELRLMLGEGGRPAMGRARLRELAARWPDRPRPSDGGSDGGE